MLNHATASDFPFYNNFVPEKLLHLKISDDVIARELVLPPNQKSWLHQCPKPCATLSLPAKTDLILLIPYYWQICVSKFRDIRKEWLCKTSCRMSNPKFDDHHSKFTWCSTSSIGNAMFVYRVAILHEILQSHPFLISQNFETQGCQMCEVERIKSIFAVKWNSGTRYGVPLYYTKYFSFLQ